LQLRKISLASSANKRVYDPKALEFIIYLLIILIIGNSEHDLQHSHSEHDLQHSHSEHDLQHSHSEHDLQHSHSLHIK
jgi:hypothetical protein